MEQRSRRDHVQCGQHVYQVSGAGGVASGEQLSFAEGRGRGVGDVAMNGIRPFEREGAFSAEPILINLLMLIQNI